MHTSRIRIAILEDHAVYRQTLALALEGQNDVELRYQFATAERMIDAIHSGQLTTDNVDLLLLDICLPGTSGIAALPRIKSLLNGLKIIMLTQSEAEKDVVAAISQGADGYLLKSASADEILDGIRTVMSGGASLDGNVARFLLDRIQRAVPNATEAPPLTEREIEILSLVGQGLLKKEISDRLQISTHTVVTHIRHIYEKLGVNNAPAAISKAYRQGLL